MAKYSNASYENTTMKFLNKFAFAVLISLFMLTSVCAEDEDAGIEKNKIYRVTEEVDLIPTVKFNYGRPKIVIKSTFPLLTSQTDNPTVDKFNELVSDLIKIEKSDFKKQ